MQKAAEQKGLRPRNTLEYFTRPIDRIFMVVVYVTLVLSALFVIIPLWFIIASSFSSTTAVATGKVLFWPVDFSLEGYTRIFQSSSLKGGFKNSIIDTVCGTAVNIVVTTLAAYPLSRRDIRGRNGIMVLFTFTMLFNGGMIPTFLVVNGLGMIDTIWAMIIPGALSVYNMILMRTYFMSSIPWELYESASIDGCRDFRYLLAIALPLAKPIVSVLVLLYAVGHWNSYFNALLYLRSSSKIPLQMVLRDVLISDNAAVDMNDINSQLQKQYLKNLLQYSTIIVSTVPVMILYPFAQRYFLSGIMIGSIKG